MDLADSASWGDATLLRPAVDPTVPRAARALLSAPGAPLTPASRPRPPRPRRSLLPDHPERRLLTVYDAVTGLAAAMAVAVTGSAPWAFGVLISQDPAGWQSATGRYALLLSELIVVVTLMVFGTRVASNGRFPRADRALAGTRDQALTARAYHGRYLTGADLDARGRVLLRRAQDAADAVRSAAAVKAGLLDAVAADAALAAQEWDIALALREHARLRASRAAAGDPPPGSPAAELLAQHRDMAEAAAESVVRRVAALDRYADEVRATDAAYRHWRQHAVIADLAAPHLDMLARTAADDHGIAELGVMTRQAAALRRSLRMPPHING